MWGEAYGELLAHDLLTHSHHPTQTSGRNQRPVKEREKTMTDLTWQKPMRCDNSSPNCVEVAVGDNDERLVRDSKNPNGPNLSFASEEWEAFEGSIRAGQRF